MKLVFVGKQFMNDILVAENVREVVAGEIAEAWNAMYYKRGSPYAMVTKSDNYELYKWEP